MSHFLREVTKAIPRVLKSPLQGLEIFWRRLFPFGIKPKDPEAYRIGSWSYGNLPREPVQEVFPGIEEIDLELKRIFDRHLWTSLDDREVLILAAVAKLFEAKTILEIGTYEGNTALNLAVNSPPDAVITTVDLPPDWDGKLGLKVPEIKVNVGDRAKIGSQFKGTPYAEKINSVFGDSATLDWSQLSGPFDIVFIDGCHDYAYVKSDTQNALQNLKPKGLLIWHDYGMYKDVSRFVDEVAKEMRVKAVKGTRLAVGFLD